VQFVAAYGGTAEWEAAERRYDTDGGLYTKNEFIEFYGGSTEWEAAATPPPPPGISSDC